MPVRKLSKFSIVILSLCAVLFLFSALFDVLFVNLPYNCVRG